MVKEIEWEEIKQKLSGYLYRAKVPGGWLIKEVQDVTHLMVGRGLDYGYDWTSSLTFMPDPEHKWLENEND